LTAAAACGGFVAAVGPAARRYQSIAAWPAHSRKSEQCHVYSRRRRLNTDLLIAAFFSDV